MNRMFIIGNLVADPELRTTKTGKPVCTFTVAVGKRIKDGVETEGKGADYFNVKTWNAMAENCGKWLAKGKKVSVIGRASVDAFIGRDKKAHGRLDIDADEVEFLSPAGFSSTENQTTQYVNPTMPTEEEYGQMDSGYIDVSEEELPF